MQTMKSSQIFSIVKVKNIERQSDQIRIETKRQVTDGFDHKALKTIKTIAEIGMA
ncbi:MAG: hypothetical protein RR400_03280 [Clostridia bacterium]